MNVQKLKIVQPGEVIAPCDAHKQSNKEWDTFVAGSTTDVKWKDVKVGQVLQVRDDELFPADLLCLYSSLPDRWDEPFGSEILLV